MNSMPSTEQYPYTIAQIRLYEFPNIFTQENIEEDNLNVPIADDST